MPDDWEIIEPQEEDSDWETGDMYDPNLGDIRASFSSELEIPEVRELLKASTKAEVGDQPEHVWQAYIESVLNRAPARGRTIADTVLDPDYYPSITHQRMSRMMGNFDDEESRRLDAMIDDVVKGSNISGYATGNESGDVHSGGAPVSYNPETGERFVQENADSEWVKNTASQPKDWEIIPPSQGGADAEDVIPLEPVSQRPGGVTAPDEAIPFDIDQPKANIPEGEPNDWEIIPPEKKSYFATEEEEQRNEGRGPNYPPELKAEEQIARGTANREKLQGAIAKVEREGYMVPHFIGLENEPEGDRAPTRDMEQLVAALARQQTNAVRARDIKGAAAIGKERKYWEDNIKSEGMTAEQWKKQTGEEDPRYPHEPAYTAKQSPEGLIDSVENAINAGKEWWATTGKKNWESTEEGALRKGVRIGAGTLGEIVNRYAYSPIVHGIREAIDYIAPGSSLANSAKKLDDAFYENTVAIPAARREQLQKEINEMGTAGQVVGAVGTMAADLPSIMLTSGLLPELKVGMELVNTLRHGAAAMTVPAMRAGTDAAEQVKKEGGSDMEQLGAFIRGTTITMGIGAVPMATKSGAATLPGRFVERAAKSVPLASAAVESGRMLDNAVSDIFGGEKRPFSLEEHLKGVAPLVLVGGVAGRDTRPSKFERTFGFSPVHLDKADWMRHRMEAEGLAKATPEKVQEWDAQWKKQQAEESPWAAQEEAPAPAAPAAASPGKPARVQALDKRSPQALGIVADPRATKGFEQAREEAKAIADYLNKAEHWGPWNSAVGNKVASEQKAIDNVMRQAEALKKLAPNAEARKGATMYREADGDRAKLVGWGANVKDAAAKAAYRMAGALKPNEITLVQKVQDRFKELNMWLNSNGIDVAERENYITHMLHTGGMEPTTGRPLRSLSSFFRYAKPRTYDSFFQAFQAGEKPKTLDIVDILSAYEITAQRAVGNKKFVDRLKFGQAKDGNPIVAPSSLELRQLGYKPLDAPGLERMLIHPDHFDDLSKMLGRSKIQDWLETRSKNPLLNVVKGVLQAGAEAQKYMKGTIFSLSFFHQLTEGTHGLGHRVNPFKTKTERIDLNDPEQYDAAVHGLMLRPDKVSQEHFMQGVGSDSYNLVTLMGRKFGGDAGKQVADFIDGYSHYLFESYIPRLKMDTYQHIVERNTARFAKDLKSGKVSTAEVKSLSADQANAAYGHLNYTKLARSPTVRHAMQLLLLAPDFFEARARFAAQAGKGAVGLLTGSKTGTEQLIALAWLGVGQYVAARILNNLDHGDPEWDPKHAFQVKTDLGGILPDKRWVGLRSVPEDIHKAFKDPWQFMLNRFSPFARLAGESAFKTNWRGEKTDFDNSLRDMIFNIVPMPLQGLTPKLREMLPESAQDIVFGPRRAQSLSWKEMLFKSTGVQIHRVSPLNDAFQMAEDWTKVNDPEEYARRQASAFPESKYRSLRYSLEDSDWEAARTEAERLEADGEPIGKNFQKSILRPFTGSFSNDQRLYDSLNEYDQKIFDAALERRVEILDRYRDEVGPIGKGIMTVDKLHKKMREAKVKDMKKRRKFGLEEEE